MPIVLLADIEVRKRQRTEIPTQHTNSLKESILARGNLHPPVCWLDRAANKWILVVGECRLNAIRKIAEDNLSYHVGAEVVKPGSIFIMSLGEALEADRFEAELDENVRRLDLSWQDRAAAYAALHTMRIAANPKHTLGETKTELIEKGATNLVTGAPMTSETHSSEVREALLIAENLGNEKIKNARNSREAIALIYKHEEEKINAALIRHGRRTTPKKSDLTLIHGDMLVELRNLDPDTVDLIIADPPYGIGAGAGGFRDRAVHHHNYDDTPENAKSLANLILSEGFRITKPRANLFMFCDIDLFPYLKTAAANFGWTPFRRPLIWTKSESEGLAPWGGSGPRITTEFFLYATKGQRGMNASPVDVFNFRRVSRTERLHAAEKPVELLTRMIEITTMPGDLVLDPCCGSGSTLVACRESKRTGLGIEKDLDYFNTAFANVHSKELKDA